MLYQRYWLSNVFSDLMTRSDLVLDKIQKSVRLIIDNISQVDIMILAGRWKIA